MTKSRYLRGILKVKLRATLCFAFAPQTSYISEPLGVIMSKRLADRYEH